MKSGIELIAAERQEQIGKHNYSKNYDVHRNDNRQLSQAALMLLSVDFEEGIDSSSYPDGWEHPACAYMISKPYKDRLVIAGALLAAELDRLSGNEEIENGNQ